MGARSRLQATFCGLAINREIRDITVQDVLDASDVSRATFYRLFSDKYDLMNSIVLDYFRKAGLTFSNGWRELTFKALEHLYENRAYLARVVHVQGQSFLYENLAHFCDGLTESTYLQMSGDKELDPKLRAAILYTTRGSLAVTYDWMERGFREPVDFVADTIFDCMPRSLAAYIH